MSLPNLKIFKESFRHVMGHKMSWLKVGFVPLILFLIGEIVAVPALFIPEVFGFALFDGQLIFPFVLLLIINAIFSVIWGPSFYVKGYRYAILNEGGDRWWYLSLNGRLLKMIGYSLFIGLLLGGSAPSIALVLNILSESQWIVLPILYCFILLWGYVIIRLSFVFPLIAINQKKPLRTSWHLLKGNVMQLGGLLSLIGFTIVAIVLLVTSFVGLIWLILKFFSPFFAAYMWALGQVVFFKVTSLLASLLFIGIGTEGIVGLPITLIIEMALGLINPLLIYIFSILSFLFIVPFVFLTWAVFTKALSLVYVTLTEEERE